jgi:hypothetical protein
VEHIVPVGSLDPDQIHVPSVYVHRLLVAKPDNRIEREVYANENVDAGPGAEQRVRIAKRAALEFKNGSYGKCAGYNPRNKLVLQLISALVYRCYAPTTFQKELPCIYKARMDYWEWLVGMLSAL